MQTHTNDLIVSTIEEREGYETVVIQPSIMKSYLVKEKQTKADAKFLHKNIVEFIEKHSISSIQKIKNQIGPKKKAVPEYFEIRQRTEGLQLSLLDLREQENPIKDENVLQAQIDALQDFVQHTNRYRKETDEYLDNYIDMLLWAYHKYFPETNLPRTAHKYDI